jgi:ribosome-associated protein
MELKRKAAAASKPGPKKAKPATKAKAKPKAKKAAKPAIKKRQIKPVAVKVVPKKAAVKQAEMNPSHIAAEKRAVAAAEAAFAKKAVDVLVLDLTGLSPVIDHMVLASATSETHLRSVADNVEEQMAKIGQRVVHREGYRDGHWIVLDYGDLMVNVFLDRQRSHYDLEKLWSRGRVVARYEI